MITKISKKKKYCSDVADIKIQDGGNFFENIFKEEKQTVRSKNRHLVGGKVADIQNGRVLFGIEGHKAQGYVSLSEFKIYPSLPQKGEEFDLYINSFESLDGTLDLSHERALRHKEWLLFEDKFNNRETVEGTIERIVKGGYIVKFKYITGFLPQSQAEKKDVHEAEDLLNKTQEFLIINLEIGSTLVVSRTEVKKNNSEEVRDFLINLKAGDVVTGKVSNIVKYGIFVTLIDGVDGLLYNKDICSSITDVESYFKVNQNIKVKVIRYTKETGKISLGMKQVYHDPWIDVHERYSVGDIVTGTIALMLKCGAFVKIEDGLEGLVHVSELAWGYVPKHPAEILSLNQVYNFIILDIAERRISLGLKQCYNNPFALLKETTQLGAIVDATIKDVTEFGLLVILSENVVGNLYHEDLTWDTDSLSALEHYRQKIGKVIKVKVLTINQAREYVVVGVKQLDDGYAQKQIQDWHEGYILKATVSDIFYTSIELFVDLGDIRIKVFHKIDINCDDETEDKIKKLKIGEIAEVAVVSIDYISLCVCVENIKLRKNPQPSQDSLSVLPTNTVLEAAVSPKIHAESSAESASSAETEKPVEPVIATKKKRSTSKKAVIQSKDS